MKIEPNNIYLGDCLEVMKHIPDKTIERLGELEEICLN